MFFVYILYSSQHDKFYVGQTNDPDDRLKRHNSGQEEATRPYLPWEMVIRIEKETRYEVTKMVAKKKSRRYETFHFTI
jgi:putative endonuclease